MARPNVVVVKIHRNSAGYTIPFDKIYFFKRGDRELIPKIFGYALVLPIDEELLEAVFQLRPKSVSHHKFRRDDDALNIETMIDEDKLDGRRHSIAQVKAWWQDNVIDQHQFEDRVAVVPILTSKSRKKRNPRYLSTKKWFDRQMKGRGRARVQIRQSGTEGEILKGAISELAYLATPKEAPNDKIRPICSICPRQLLQLQGECMPGQLICYKSIDFNKIDDEVIAQEAAE